MHVTKRLSVPFSSLSQSLSVSVSVSEVLHALYTSAEPDAPGPDSNPSPLALLIRPDSQALFAEVRFPPI
jgi:hypothetical protein